MIDPDEPRPTGPPGPAPTGPAGPGPTGPAGPRPKPREDDPADIDAVVVAELDRQLATLSELATATFEPEATVPGPRFNTSVVLLFRLRMARQAVRELARAYGIQTPARQDHPGPRGDSCPAAAGGPVQPPVAAGEARAPGCVTAALSTAGTGSAGLDPSAGADVPVVASTRDRWSAGGAGHGTSGAPQFLVGTALMRGSVR
jgi:hypothetical protein